MAIKVQCPHCPEYLDSPEVLVSHLEIEHDRPVPLSEQCFVNNMHFQFWLATIEDSRSDGGYLGSEEGPSEENEEYYLLCRRRCTNVKRRRLDSCNDDCSSSSADSDSGNVIVSCTAFVHVMVKVDGGVFVRYCLEHSGHQSENKRHLKRLVRNRKRNHLSCEDQDQDQEPEHEHHEERQDIAEETSSVSSLSSPHVTPKISLLDPLEEANNNNVEAIVNNNNNNELTMDNRMEPVEPMDHEIDVSSMNVLIGERLDSTANRLRALTQVLADLAVDINACEERPVQCLVAI